MIDEILERLNVKYEDLNAAERETLNTWIEAIEKSALTVERIRDFISQMRAGVERDITKTTNNTKQDTFLKARLRNYLLIEAFLTSPEKAKQQLEQAVAGLASPLTKKSK